MANRECADCGRKPFFRVKGGPVKQDKYHTLCQACFRDQTNSVKAQVKVRMKDRNLEEINSWESRHNAIRSAMENGSYTFSGREFPDPEDPSDPSFEARIIIGASGAGTEIYYPDKGLFGSNIPALRVYAWDKTNFSYLKHWFAKVIDDPGIFRAHKIHVIVLGEWAKTFWKTK